MCQHTFFPCLQEINMLRSKREEQKKQMCIFNPEFRKKSDARVYRVQKKINSWLRKILRSFKNSSYL